MSQRLSAALVILFAVAQLPFAYIGLSVLAGIARDGPWYFYFLYLSTSDVESLAQSGDIPGPRLARAAPHPNGTAGGVPRRPRSDPPAQDFWSLPGQDPVGDRAASPQRRIVDLPAYRTESGLRQRLSLLQGLPVDYVSVPRKARDGASDEMPVVVTLHSTAERRVVLLAGRPGLTWRFEGRIPQTLAGVLLIAPDPEPDDLVIGLPDGLPAARLDLT